MFEQGVTPQKATCSTHTRVEEEDAVVQEGANSAKDKADKLQPMKITLITGKMVQTQYARSKAGGASMPNQVDKSTPIMFVFRVEGSDTNGWIWIIPSDLGFFLPFPKAP